MPITRSRKAKKQEASVEKELKKKMKKTELGPTVSQKKQGSRFDPLPVDVPDPGEGQSAQELLSPRPQRRNDEDKLQRTREEVAHACIKLIATQESSEASTSSGDGATSEEEDNVFGDVAAAAWGRKEEALKGEERRKKIVRREKTLSPINVSTGSMDIENALREIISKLQVIERNGDETREDVKGIIADNVKFRKSSKKIKMTVSSVIETMGSMQVEEEAIKTKVTIQEDRVSKLERENELLTEKMEMSENQTRRNNLKIVGIPEEKETNDMMLFVKEVIKESSQIEDDVIMEIERAHRALRPKPALNQRPRTIMVKFLRSGGREMVLQKVREKLLAGEQINYQGQKVIFYPDLSIETLNKRKKFVPAKNLLWQKKYRFSMLQSGVSRVTLDTGNKFFNDPNQASEFAEKLPVNIPANV